MSDQPNPATVHQDFQAFPRLDAPIGFVSRDPAGPVGGFSADPPASVKEPGTASLDPIGTPVLLSQPWQRLFIRLWQMVGGSNSTIQGTAITKVNASGDQATLVDVASGKPVGTIGLPVASTTQVVLESLQISAIDDPLPPAAQQVIIAAPPVDPVPDPLLVLALHPLAGIAP